MGGLRARQTQRLDSSPPLRSPGMTDTRVGLQAKLDGGHPNGTHDQAAGKQQMIRDSLGGGRELPRSDRAFFEPRFGADFTDVRIRDDAQADAAARGVGATAFTLGSDIVFRSGAYNDSHDGQRLLAHELTHVVQQSALGPSGPAISPNRIQRQEAEGGASNGSDVAESAAEPMLLVDIESLVSTTTDVVPVWRALGLLDAPRRPDHIAPFPQLIGGEKIPDALLAGLPLLAIPAARKAAEQAPKLILIEGGAGATAGTTLTPWGLRALGVVGVVVGVMWPTSTAPPWMDTVNPITRGPYTSEAEYEWERSLDEQQRNYLRDLYSQPGHGVDRAGDSEKDEDGGSCEEDFPDHPECWQLPDDYEYDSPREALEAMKSATGNKSLSFHSPSPTTSGPCPGLGTHLNVRSGGRREGSITCCPCCLDGPAHLTTKCRIVW